MSTATGDWMRESVDVGGTSLELVKGGSGEPLLLLHGEMGHPGWLRFHEALARDFTLYIPSHPGFGRSGRPDWIMNMRDLAGWYGQALEELDLSPVHVMGFSLGGWLAAEMATMCRHTFKSLTLVGAMGIKPPAGEILDMFLIVAKEYLEAGFLDPEAAPEFRAICPEEPDPEQVEAWEVAREEASRLSWRPYAHYPALPQLLKGVKGLKSLIVWGNQDPVVPVSAAHVYRDSLDGSQLALLDGCGHHPEIEKTDQFVLITREFLKGA